MWTEIWDRQAFRLLNRYNEKFDKVFEFLTSIKPDIDSYMIKPSRITVRTETHIFTFTCTINQSQKIEELLRGD